MIEKSLDFIAAIDCQAVIVASTQMQQQCNVTI